MQLGDLGTWSNTVVTAGALGAAFMVYRIESRRDREAEKDRRARFEAERRVQADKIAAWFETPRPPGSVQYPAVVANSSDLPVFDVSASFWFVSPDSDSRPGEHRADAQIIRVIPPGERIEIPSSLHFRQAAVDGIENYRVAIEFRDAAGSRWRRDVYGKLTDQA